MTKNEKELVQLCLAGQRNAQQELYARYKTKMFGICLRYAKSRETAEDVLLDGFMKVFRDLGQFQFKGSLEGWIRKVIVNTALMHLRKKHRFDFQPIDNELIIERLEVEPTVLQDIRVDAIIAQIQQLPIGYQTIFNLFAIEGFSHKEIGEKLGIKESTSRSQYTRARRLLQGFLLKERVV
ncbi:MAG: RNA polymerase sigma factor (sigma-70 family) [Paraglaciecola sp.]|jgi:RNA polymerase sigma factor (sigma-70 family)